MNTQYLSLPRIERIKYRRLRAYRLFAMLKSTPEVNIRWKWVVAWDRLLHKEEFGR
jgi:hypothetical protein